MKEPRAPISVSFASSDLAPVTVEPQIPPQLSDGYRSARRVCTVISAIAIAWSAAQVELRTLKVEFAGELDINAAFIPLLLLTALVYACARGAVEYAMQSVEVRRWGYAQADVNLSLLLVQFAMLALASSGLERSPRAVWLILAAAVLSFLVALATIFGLMLVYIFSSILRSKIRGVTRGIAAVVIEGTFYGMAFAILALAATPIILAVAFHTYAPLRDLLIAPPTVAGSVLFCTATLLVLFSFAGRRWWSTKLFAIPSRYIHWITRDGREMMEGQSVPPTVWDWYATPRPKPTPPRRVRKKLTR